MSLITRCPHCGTRFRVVPDQLKLADGWVRCGQCAEVFDAQLSMVTVPVPAEAEVLAEGDASTLPLPAQGAASPPEPEPRPAEPSPPQSEPAEREVMVFDEPEPRPVKPWTQPAPPPEREVMVFDEPEPPPAKPSAQQSEPPEREVMVFDEPAPAPEPEPEPEPEPTPAEAAPEGAAGEPAPADETASGRIEPVLDFEIPDEDIAAADAAKAASAAAGEDAQAPAEPQDPADPEDDPPPQDAPSFVREAYRRAFWRRPEIRVLLVLLSLLLSLLMAAQLALQQRDFLAARVPVLRPLLQALCKPLQCRVGLPQRIESIVIDGSSFTRLRPDAYRLSVTLSNQASTAVAMPALELTLTDTQDQPVLRRVLQPADLGPETPLAIAPSSEWSSTLTLAVAANARIAGYRLLAFYP